MNIDLRKSRPESTGRRTLARIFQDWKVNEGYPDSRVLLLMFRLAQVTRPVPLLGPLIYWSYTVLAYTVYAIELSPNVSVGARLRIHHPHLIIVNAGSAIGSDCTLRHGVTIGNTLDREGGERGSATLGDHVDVGAGSALLGPIHIGDHARIGANTTVLDDVPPWGVVVGAKGRLTGVDRPATE